MAFAATLRRWWPFPAAGALFLLALAGYHYLVATAPPPGGRADAAHLVVAESKRVSPGKPRGVSDWLPAWFDDRTLVFASSRSGGNELWLVGSDGSGLRQLTSATLAEDWIFKTARLVNDTRHPAAAPGGGPLACVRNNDIWTLARDGQRFNRLTADGESGNPCWFPAGNELLFTTARNGEPALWRMRADGSDAVPVRDEPGGLGAVALAPDGRRVAYVTRKAGNPDLWVYDLETGQATAVVATAEIESNPAWSPDGGKLVFVARRGSDANLWVVNADGSAPTQLTFTPQAKYAPAWSPDGTRIACHQGEPGQYELWLYTLGYSKLY